jgi:SAM-dependent methyltransferase
MDTVVGATAKGEQHEGLLVREATGRYGEQLAKRTEQFLQQMKQFREECHAVVGMEREALMDEITFACDGVLSACAEFEVAAGDDAVLLGEARNWFRERTQAVFADSRFITHARTWPFGYQGDFQILEHAYRNIPLSDGLGWYLDRYCLHTSLCIAVRERKTSLMELLREEMARKERARILDVACGSCRDVFELAPEITASGAVFTCVDFDPAALQFTANRMVHAGLNDEQVLLRQYNALRMVNPQRNRKEFGEQDVIYSVGFFDYLKDDLLIRLLSAMRELLAPGGRLIASFKDRNRYGTQFYHWMVDWDGFDQRTPEDCRNLLARAGMGPGSYREVRDRSGVILFFVITK